MATPEARLAWYRRASENLRRYLAELQAGRGALRERGIDTSATDQLIAEVNRRLRELQKLLSAEEGPG